jgi:hypothetical protein
VTGELRLLHAPVPAELVEALYADAGVEQVTLAELLTRVLGAYLADVAGFQAVAGGKET